MLSLTPPLYISSTVASNSNLPSNLLLAFSLPFCSVPLPTARSCIIDLQSLCQLYTHHTFRSLLNRNYQDGQDHHSALRLRQHPRPVRGARLRGVRRPHQHNLRGARRRGPLQRRDADQGVRRPELPRHAHHPAEQVQHRDRARRHGEVRPHGGGRRHRQAQGVPAALPRGRRAAGAARGVRKIPPLRRLVVGPAPRAGVDREGRPGQVLQGRRRLLRRHQPGEADQQARPGHLPPRAEEAGQGGRGDGRHRGQQERDPERDPRGHQGCRVRRPLRRRQEGRDGAGAAGCRRGHRHEGLV